LLVTQKRANINCVLLFSVTRKKEKDKHKRISAPMHIK
jgi:hypothetical protein